MHFLNILSAKKHGLHYYTQNREKNQYAKYHAKAKPLRDIYSYAVIIRFHQSLFYSGVFSAILRFSVLVNMPGNWETPILLALVPVIYFEWEALKIS